MSANTPKIVYNLTEELKETFNKGLLVGRGIGIFAGAGVSVPSGIQTFRGANQMDYFEGYPPTYLSTLETLQERPETCWKFFLYLYQLVQVAEPSVTHKVIANWQNKYISRGNGSAFCLITTNFDGLLSKAGAIPHELHGNINKAKCLVCNNVYSMDALDLQNLPPKCECGQILKPNITLLNDYVSEDAYQQAMRISCAFYFCIGTSGVNNHAANFFKHIKDKKMATLIEINPRPSYLTKDMHYVIRGNAEDILPQFEYAKVQKDTINLGNQNKE